jgi:phenylacetic acid degradation operon negative regulatory protein
MKFRLTKIFKEILKKIAENTLDFPTKVFPGSDLIFKIFESQSYDERYYRKKLIQKLVNEKIIYLSKEKIQLTSKGYKIYKNFQIDEIKVEKIKKWDGTWHLVCYDIPEKFKKNRDYFRRKLIDFGFSQIQKSLWALPWECKEEIAIISKNIGINPFVVYMNTKEIPNQEKLKDKYHLE